jgi:hypothetical protein
LAKLRRRSRFSSPRFQRRLSLTLIGTGALFAGVGAVIRASTPDGSTRHSASHLFDAAAWLIVVIAAVIETISASLLFQIEPRGARRRGVLLAALGVLAALLGCYLASSTFDDDSPAVLSGAANVVLVGGIGAGLAGVMSLGWQYGGAYAARRIEKLGEDDW